MQPSNQGRFPDVTLGLPHAWVHTHASAAIHIGNNAHMLIYKYMEIKRKQRQ